MCAASHFLSGLRQMLVFWLVCDDDDDDFGGKGLFSSISCLLFGGVGPSSWGAWPALLAFLNSQKPYGGPAGFPLSLEMGANELAFIITVVSLYG